MKNTKSTSLKHAFDECIGRKALLQHADTCRFLNWVREPEKKRKMHVFPVILTMLLIIGVGITGLGLVMSNIGTEQAPAEDLNPIIPPDLEEKEVPPEETAEINEPTLEEIFQENPKYEILYQELVTGFDKLALYRDSKHAYAEVTIYYLYAVWTGNEELVKKYLSPFFTSDYQLKLWFEENLPFYNEVKDYDAEVMYVTPSLGEPVVSIQIDYTSSSLTKSRLYHLDLQNEGHAQYMTIWDDDHNSIDEGDVLWRTIRWNAQIGLTKELAIELFGEPTLSGTLDGKEVWLFDEVANGEEYNPSLNAVSTDAISNEIVYYQLLFTFEDNEVSRYALYTRSNDGSVYEYIKNGHYEVIEGPYGE